MEWIIWKKKMFKSFKKCWIEYRFGMRADTGGSDICRLKMAGWNIDFCLLARRIQKASHLPIYDINKSLIKTVLMILVTVSLAADTPIVSSALTNAFSYLLSCELFSRHLAGCFTSMTGRLVKWNHRKSIQSFDVLLTRSLHISNAFMLHVSIISAFFQHSSSIFPGNLRFSPSQ